MTRLRPLIWPLVSVCLILSAPGRGTSARLGAAAGVAAQPQPQQKPPNPPPKGQPPLAQVQPVTAPPPARGVISGAVTTLDGTPVARARILVSADELTDPRQTDPRQPDKKVLLRRIGLTDSAGRFAIGQLPVGKTFVVAASKTGFASRAFGEITPGHDPAVITLAQGETHADVNIQLVVEVTIQGHVKDDRQIPMAGVLVEALRLPVGAGRDDKPLVVADCVSDDRGEYRLQGLATGQYVVRASDPALTVPDDATRSTAPPTFYPSALSIDKAQPVAALAGGRHLEGIDIGLQSTRAVPPPAEAPPAMRGVVSGRVISMATGAPLAGARVVVTADELADQPLRSAITDDLGRYTIGSLPASSSIIVTAGRVGFASSAFGELPPATPPVFIELAANGRKNNVDIDLLQQVAITGHVFDEDGAPFGGAIVEALRAVYEAGRRDLIVIAGGTTDSTGAYRVFGLSPGQYIISAFDPAYAAVGDADGALYYGATYFPASLASDRAEHVTLAPGEDRDGLDLTLQLTRPARVSGILSASNLPLISGQQQPFTGGSVFMTPLLDNDLPSYSVSDAPLKPDLSFAFNNVLPGRYAIWARADTDKPSRSYFARLTLSVGGADVPGVPLALSPGCVINGAVRWVGHDGRKPPSVVATRDIRVRAPMGDGTSLGDALTGKLNADNTFSIPGVMAGDHVIRLENLPEPWHLDTVYTTDGVNMTEVPLDTSSHSHIDVIVTLTDQATEIVGHLTVERRDLLPTFNVIAFPANPVLWRPDTRRIQLVHPDAQGNYDITGLPPGDYYVVAAQDVDEGDLNNPKILDNLRGAATRDNQVVLADVTAYKVVNLQGLIRRWNDTPRPRWPR